MVLEDGWDGHRELVSACKAVPQCSRVRAFSIADESHRREVAKSVSSTIKRSVDSFTERRTIRGGNTRGILTGSRIQSQRRVPGKRR